MAKNVKCKTCGVNDSSCFIMLQVQTFEDIECPKEMNHHFGITSWPLCLDCIVSGKISVRVEVKDSIINLLPSSKS